MKPFITNALNKHFIDELFLSLIQYFQTPQLFGINLVPVTEEESYEAAMSKIWSHYVSI